MGWTSTSAQALSHELGLQSVGLAVAIGEDLGVEPFLREDAKDFCCTGSVPQPIDFSDQGPLALDKEAENFLCILRYLLQAHLHLTRRHPNTRHPDLLV